MKLTVWLGAIPSNGEAVKDKIIFLIIISLY